MQSQAASSEPLPGTLQLRPNPGPELVPEPGEFDLLPWLAIGAGLILGLFFVAWQLRRRSPSPLPLRELFRQQLGLVENKLAEGLPTTAIVHLAAYLRAFLQNHLRLPAFARTTEELLPQLSANAGAIERTLRLADAVKFSGQVPAESQVRTVIADLRAWLESLPAADAASEPRSPV